MIPAGYQTSADIRRQIRDCEEDQERLREKIDRLAVGSPEREGMINMLFSLHDEINELAAIAYTT